MNTASYRPSSWAMLILSKVLPTRFFRKFIEIDKREYAARERVKQLGQELLSDPSKIHVTPEIREAARKAAQEVLNGAA